MDMEIKEWILRSKNGYGVERMDMEMNGLLWS